MKYKTINNTKYELEQHDNNKKLSEIKIKKGWRLLKPWEAQRLWDLGYLRDNWFFVENINKELKEIGRVAGFDANSDRAGIVCYWAPDIHGDSLGVLLCKDLMEQK